MKFIEKFDILNRWTGAVQFTADIEVSADMLPRFKIGLAVLWARESGADMRDVDLRGADLRGMDMRGVDMRGVDLRGADMRGADLRGVDMRGVDLRGADMRDVDMRDADMRDADMRGADMRGADMRDVDMRDADMRDADLRGVDMRGANLRTVKADLWMTLSQSRAEIPTFIRSMLDGKIDGSQYEGQCACLVGTISNIRGVSYSTAFPDASTQNPAEQWFLMISKGDKPSDDTGGGVAIAKALEWTLDYCAVSGVKLPAKLKAEATAMLDARKVQP